MFFRLTLLIVFLTGCSWWGEDLVKRDRVTISRDTVTRGTPLECSNEIGVFFADFFKGLSSETKIENMKVCLQNSIDNLFRLTGKEEVYLTRARFKVALKSIKRNSSKEHLNKVADLFLFAKRLFVGGDPQGVSYQEWQVIRKALEEVALIFKKAHTDIKEVFFIQGLNAKKRFELYKRLKQSFLQLDRLRVRLNGEINQKELDVFLGHVFENKVLNPFLNLAKLGVRVVLGSESAVFKSAQLQVFERAWVVFESQARLRHLKLESSFVGERNMEDLLASMDLLSKGFLKWAHNYKQYEVSFELMASILKEASRFENMGFLKRNFSLLKNTLKNILIKVFHTQDLDQKAIDRVYSMVQVWLVSQKHFLKQHKKVFHWAKGILERHPGELVHSEQAESLINLNEVHLKKVQFKRWKKGRVVFHWRPFFEKGHRAYFDKSFKQFLLVLLQPIVRAYSSEHREVPVLSREDIKKLILDFRPLGLKVGFSNPYSCDAGTRVFLEANSLTTAGNGDDVVSLVEFSEWLGTMLVVSSVSDMAMEGISKNCAYGGDQLFDVPFYKRSCFSQEVFSKSNSSSFLNFFPSFSKYLKLISDKGEEALKEVHDQSSDVLGWFKEVEMGGGDKLKSYFLNSFNLCLSQKSFPLSKMEFGSAVAVLVYMERVFQAYDTESPPDKVWQKRVKKPNFILDGKEISRFVSEKFKTEKDQDNFKEALNNEFPGLGYVLSPYNLSSMYVKLSPYKAFYLLNEIQSKSKGKYQSSLLKQYCEDVFQSSKRGTIQYQKAQSLSCMPPN